MNVENVAWFSFFCLFLYSIKMPIWIIIYEKDFNKEENVLGKVLVK